MLLVGVTKSVSESSGLAVRLAGTLLGSSSENSVSPSEELSVMGRSRTGRCTGPDTDESAGHSIANLFEGGISTTMDSSGTSSGPRWPAITGGMRTAGNLVPGIDLGWLTTWCPMDRARCRVVRRERQG